MKTVAEWTIFVSTIYIDDNAVISHANQESSDPEFKRDFDLYSVKYSGEYAARIAYFFMLQRQHEIASNKFFENDIKAKHKELAQEMIGLDNQLNRMHNILGRFFMRIY